METICCSGDSGVKYHHGVALVSFLSLILYALSSPVEPIDTP
jgi:hypothetical protein